MNKQQDGTKKSFVERYEEKQERRKKITKSGTYLYAIIGLPVCFVAAFLIALSYFGSGAFCYSDKAYEEIAQAMSDCSVEEHGFDRDTFKTKVDRYVEVYDDGETSIEGSLKFGYFRATLLMKLDENYHIVDNTGIRNYASADDYVRKFVLEFGACVLIGSLGSWFLLKKILQFFLAGIVWAIRKDKKAQTSKQPEKTDGDSKSENSVATVSEASKETNTEASKEEPSTLTVVSVA